MRYSQRATHLGLLEGVAKLFNLTDTSHPVDTVIIVQNRNSG
jgi:hypothetical protein